MLKVNALCIEPGCKKLSSFGEEGGPFNHCGDHKTPTMIPRSKCAMDGCPKVGCFKHGGRRYCADHKPEESRRATKQDCRHEGCSHVAVFGVDEDKPTMCSEHKADGMVLMASIRCKYGGCSKRRVVGVEGSPPEYCTEHAERDMVNLTSARCMDEGCLKQRHYGHPGGVATHCADHAPAGSINLKSKTCQHEGCTRRPHFGHPMQGAPTHCAEHKTSGMEELYAWRCGCGTKVVKEDQLCAVCYATQNPDDPIVKAHNKTEEKLKLFYNERGAAIGAVGSELNRKNVRGRYEWLGRRELDFVLLSCVNDECDGAQHFKDLPAFGSTYELSIENDVVKTTLALENGMSVTRMPQEDIWSDRYDWRGLKLVQIAAGFCAAKVGVPCLIVAKKDSKDTRYDGYLAEMSKTKFSERMCSVRLAGAAGDVAIIAHVHNGEEYRVHVPKKLSLGHPGGRGCLLEPVVAIA